jgi:nuclear control of ATPase protein 2
MLCLVYCSLLLIKVVLHRGLLEMDQILRANAINFAVLAALPAFGLSLLLLVLLRAWVQRVCI